MTLEQQRSLLKTPVETVARAKCFPLGGVRVQRTKDALKRAHGAQARKLVRPENAEALLKEWPQLGETTHALLPGDFVFGDLVEVMLAQFGSPVEMWISTLSLSERNIGTLCRVAKRCRLHFFLSNYFQSTSKELFGALEAALKEHSANWTLTVARVHAKVLLWRPLLRKRDEPLYTLETSANLRSSNSLEFCTVFTDPAVFFFHETWMRELEERSQKGELEGYATTL